MADTMQRGTRVAYMLFLLVSSFLGAVGQAFFKIAVVSGTSELLVIYSVVGLFVYAVSTLIYFYVLGRTHLSWAYGFQGLAYIFASLIAFAFLGETVSALRWLGIIVIAIGTALIGAS